MAAEVITLNITPTGDMPVLHLAQYDTNRPFGIALKWGEDDYTLPEGITCELQMRKTDSNLVTITPTGSSQNVLEFECTEQMCTCPGKNIAQLALLDESDNVIHTLRFEIEVQRDVMQGGLTSVSDIHNLETQIEETIDEKMGEDYYTKVQTDAAIAAAIAEVPTFDPTNYYDKSDVDGLLADKADISDLPDMSNYYTKSETDTALSTKADAASTYNMTQVNNLLNLRLPRPQEQEVQNLPASVVTIANAGEYAPLSELTVAVASGFSGANIVRCGKNFADIKPFANWSVIGSYLCYQNALPKDQNFYMSFADNDTSVDVSGCYFGFLDDEYSGGSITGHFKWILNNGTYTANNNLISGPKLLNGFVIYPTNEATYNKIMSRYKIQVELGSTATTYEPYNGTTYAITFGQTLTQSGVLDCISGVLTLADESTIQCQGVEIDTLLHDNNIYSDTGDILSMKYIIAGSEDVFKYIRMIKG